MSEVSVFINGEDCVIENRSEGCEDDRCINRDGCWAEREIYYDETTGTLNKKGLMRKASSMLGGYEEDDPQHEGYKPHLIVGDLNNFKQVNDTYGHLAGDGVLRRAAEVIEEVVRADDAVACRPHGDEFIIFVITSDPGAIMQRLSEAIEKDSEVAVAGTSHSLSTLGIKASWGAVPYEGAEMNDLLFEAAFSKADCAMYKNKETYKSREKKKTSMRQRAAGYLSSLMPSIIH